jgi:C-terminal peptidase prc
LVIFMDANPRTTFIFALLSGLVVICLLTSLCASGGLAWWALTQPSLSTQKPTHTPSPARNGQTTERHLRIFDELWTTVQRDYLYPDYNGVDWDAIREEYRVHIEKGLNDQDFWRLMDDLLGELGDDHSFFLSPDDVAEQEKMQEGTVDYVGVGFTANARPEKGFAVILQIIPNSPADQAGLMPHDVILEADGVPICCEADGSDSLHRLRGAENSSLELKVQTPGQSPRALVLTRAQIQSSIPIEVQRLEGNVGYILIPNLWDETLFEQVHRALMDLSKDGELQGLIIDMRINPGGSSTVLKGLLSLFTDGPVGHFVSSTHKTPLHIKGVNIADSQNIPLAVLVGKDTISFAEVFSGILQETRGAHVVGRPTEGNIETLHGYDFEDGSQAWIACESFSPPSGTNWEEAGIVPELEIPLDWEDFTKEDDAQLMAAIELLRDQYIVERRLQIDFQSLGKDVERRLTVETKHHPLQVCLPFQVVYHRP